jgi:hypothetical protein
MPDTTITPITVDTADGWMVISKLLQIGSVTPPYRYHYDAVCWLTLAEAEEHYDALGCGEFTGWQPVAIIPCKSGVPLGAKVMP